ncbi:hypothetical protein Q8F55_008264 [Vanrija albida]|uniref:Major facilitator superfamily (MFS) profile domain-containing protein n=1 Tax=Vanrija albida TaxID=181172 RepID=A0ABR3PVW7_9TREE
MAPPDNNQLEVHNEATGMDPYLVAQAKAAHERDMALGFRKALKNFGPGIFFSMMLSVALIMEGFDVAINGSYWGQSWFLKRFGDLQPDGTYVVSASWQAACGNASGVGSLIGLMANGYSQYHWGSKPTYLVAMVGMAAAIFLPVFATNVKVLFAGNFACGLFWGVFQTLTTAYASEIAPTALRAHMTSFVNICWACGLFIGSGVVKATLHIDGYMSYRLPFMLQWIWPVPLFVCACFAPESPWFLIRKGKDEKARRAIRRTARKGYFTEADIDAEVALIRHTLEIEKNETKQQGILNCFRGSNLRRTEITCLTYAIQTWCGQPMTGLATQILTRAGMNEDDAFSINMGMFGMLFVGTVLVWGGMGKWGRRRIYLIGQVAVALCLLGMGILGSVKQSTNILYGIGAFMMLLNLVFACSLGPLCYAIVGELPGAEVRGPTIALARATYGISGVITGQLNPRMITEWGWNVKVAFFYLGTCLIGLVYTYFRLPETQHRSFGELDVLFNNRVPARKFKTTKVDQFFEHSGSLTPTDEKDFEKEAVSHVEKV